MRIHKHIRTLAGVIVIGTLAAVALWPEATEVDIATVATQSACRSPSTRTVSRACAIDS